MRKFSRLLNMTLEQNIQVAKNAIKVEIEGLTALLHSIGSAFHELVEKILSANGKIIVGGIGKSGHVARKLAATMSSLGFASCFLHPSEAGHGDLGIIAVNDIVILLSNSGNNNELTTIINYCQQRNITLIGITREEHSTLYKLSTLAIVLPRSPEASKIGIPTTSTIQMAALSDALAVVLEERTHFNKDLYRLYHPNGQIGLKLLLVKDIMHKGDALPVIEAHTTAMNAIITMTTKRLGCTIVMSSKGYVVGIITDGDLRRKIGLNFNKSTASDLMTHNPICIAEDVLASYAVALMHNKKIAHLIVVKEEKPIGIVHLHDLLTLGYERNIDPLLP